jgi:hypothetical protein
MSVLLREVRRGVKTGYARGAAWSNLAALDGV